MTHSIRVELHCQSSASDGDHAPEMVARILARAEVAWAALTDHNTIAGQQAFRESLSQQGIHFLPGLEIDARSPQGPLHLLAYGFELTDSALLRTLETLRHPLRTSARRLVGRRALEHPPGTAEAIQLVHQAGGRVFLAHPLAFLRTIERLEAVLDWLQPQGLDGLEAFHKPYPVEIQRQLVDLATRRGLLVAAGSDFHGPHHTDGTSPGIDMPLDHWFRFAAALRLSSDAFVQAGAAGVPVHSGNRGDGSQ